MRKRKGMAVIAAIVMTAVMSLGSSLAATSVGISDGAAAATVNQTVVGFAGHEWWVIGDAKGGVYSKADSVTLLSKNYDFGNTAFNERDNWGNTEYPNAYKGSTLQRKMESIADNFSAKERGKINNRTLSSSDDKNYPIRGGDIADQQLWPLSKDEYDAITSESVRSYGYSSLLRSFSLGSNYHVIFAPADGGSPIHGHHVSLSISARPALNLNVTSVIFTSNAGQTGKAAATPGGGLVSVTTPDTTSTNNKIKYTFKDDSLKLGNVDVSKIEKNTVTVKYTGATAGKNLSLIVKDSKGAVTHYSKLAEKIKAEGEASFTLPDGFDSSKNKVEVFVEEIGKDDNHSDFASPSKAINTVTVNGGSGSNYYTEGEEVTLTAAPAPEGKYFKGWNISPAVTLKDGGTVTSGIIKFDMPAHAVTATAEYEDLIVYSVKDGDNTGWTQGDQGGLTITSEGEHRKFTDVSVDGVVLDRQHYTVESGSTIVTLKASYLSTLSVGEHILRIHFTDGYTETKFSIQAAQTDNPNPPPTTDPGEPTTPVEPGEPNPPIQGGTTTATTVATAGTSPKTGDSNMIWIMVSLMLGAGIGFMVINVMKKSKRRNR